MFELQILKVTNGGDLTLLATIIDLRRLPDIVLLTIQEHQETAIKKNLIKGTP